MQAAEEGVEIGDQVLALREAEDDPLVYGTEEMQVAGVVDSLDRPHVVASGRPDDQGMGGEDQGRQVGPAEAQHPGVFRSEEHTSELQSLMRISYAVFCLKKKTKSKRS